MFSTKKTAQHRHHQLILEIETGRQRSNSIQYNILQQGVFFTFSSIEEIGGSVNQCLVVESDKGLEEGGMRKNETAKYVEFIIFLQSQSCFSS